MTSGPDQAAFRADVRSLFLSDSDRRVAVASTSDGPLTCVVTGTPATATRKAAEPLVVRVATSPSAAPAVEREAMLLVELRRRRLGPLEATIPRHVGTRSFNGLPVSLASQLPGRSMSADYHQWFHTARPRMVRRDYQYAADWLASFQDASAVGTEQGSWVSEVAAALEARWSRSPVLAAAMTNLAGAGALDEARLPRTAVHGDYAFRNLLLDDRGVTGVVGWFDGEPEGSPLRDLVRFALSYSRSLAAHVGPGHYVAGHPGLRRVGCEPGIRYALTGHSWYSRLIRSYLADGLTRLGLPSDRWYDAALVGIGEIAAHSRDGSRAADYLDLLAALPARPALARLA